MKLSTITLCMVLAASTVQAQSDLGESKMKTATQSSETKTKGIVVGLVYSNLTKVDARSTYDKQLGNGATTSVTDSMSDDTHAGLAGLNVGYKNYYAWGPLGFDASATVFKGINKSETPADTTIYKIQSNVVYPFTNNLSIAGGLNISYIDFKPGMDVKIEPGVGGQIGLQADFKNIGVMLGYQAIGARYKYDMTTNFRTSTATIDYLISGMVSQVSYTF